MQLIEILLSLLAFTAASWAQANRPTLTKVAQIRALAADEARRTYPLQLRGVITFRAPEYNVTFFQDETGGIFVFVKDPNLRMPVGSLVEVKGTTSAGDFAPAIEHSHIRLLGRATLPRAAPATLQELLTGAQDSQWVEVSGTVHSMAFEDRLPPDMRSGPKHLVLEIASGGEKFKARVRDFRNDGNYASLVGSTVDVRGACGTLFNDRRQLVGVQLFVPSMDHVVVKQKGPGDPYTLPVVSIGSLMQFSPARASGRIIHVRGVVTLVKPGNYIFLQDESGGVTVESKQTIDVRRGDVVDAIGFPTVRHYAPILQDGSFRKYENGRYRPPTS